MSKRLQRGERNRIVAGVALLAALTGCGEEVMPPELPPRAIQWLRVSGGVSSEQRVISGIVTAISDTQLAFEVGGIVETVEVSLGDVVENEQVLARLDPEPFRLTVSDAEAALAEVPTTSGPCGSTRRGWRVARSSTAPRRGATRATARSTPPRRV
jgi:multidrug efflux pump subunit AcrA (membrane-fusion protein)